MTKKQALKGLEKAWSDIRKFVNVPTEYKTSALLSDSAYNSRGQIYVILDFLVDKKTGNMTLIDEWEIDLRYRRKK